MFILVQHAIEYSSQQIKETHPFNLLNKINIYELLDSDTDKLSIYTDKN